MVKHNCNKEAELATMMEKINNIDLKIDKTDIKIDKLDTKVDKFIEKADDTYATKAELKSLEKQVEKNTNKLWSIAKEVAYGAGMLTIITKLIGLW